MKTELIKSLLTAAGVPEDKHKEIVDGIMAENGKDLAAEKAKTDAKAAELATANDTIKNLQDTVKQFDGKDPVKLQADLDALQQKYNTDIAAEQKKASDITKNFALKDVLTAAGVIDPEYFIYKHGGLEKFAFADDKPVGIDDIIKPYKENSPHLFKTEEKKSWGMSHEGRKTTETQTGREEANEAFRALLRKE